MRAEVPVGSVAVICLVNNRVAIRSEHSLIFARVVFDHSTGATWYMWPDRNLGCTLRFDLGWNNRRLRRAHQGLCPGANPHLKGFIGQQCPKGAPSHGSMVQPLGNHVVSILALVTFKQKPKQVPKRIYHADSILVRSALRESAFRWLDIESPFCARCLLSPWTKERSFHQS